MDRLGLFVMETSDEPWEMGFSDCVPWVRRWVTCRNGLYVDSPAYTSDREAFVLICRAGGLDNLISGYEDSLGLSETQYPERGDIGVIEHSLSLGGETAAICLGNRKWLIRRKKDGRATNDMIEAEAIKAWTLGRKSM